MNNIINNIITGLNNIGSGFCDYTVSMLIQSSVLIALLFIIDFILRKRVRAVFRYCIWMLVFIKLILPTSFTMPTGVGYWLSDYWPKESIVSAVKHQPASKQVVPVTVPMQSEVTFPKVTTPTKPVPAVNETAASQFRLVALSWQAMIFIAWFVGVLVLSALLIQRVFFVRALIAQSKSARGRLFETLQLCRSQLGVRKKVQLRLSDNALSPAVCGLFKPIILMPTGLLEKLSREKLQTVLVHELAHIKRADIWVNLVQTVLQVVYFYNPLVWLANMMVRRIREQAVDEMVLVSLKQEAETYSNTLIDIGQMAFLRPSLSLRLVGVVESKKALQRRIKHMLNCPIPKTAKLGIVSLLAIIVIGCAVLPMARADKNKTNSDITASKSKQNKFAVILPNGVTVELIGVCEHPSDGKQWWRPDGSLLDAPLYKTTGSELPEHEGYTYYEFAARMQGPSDTNIKWDVPRGRQGSYTGSPIGFDGKRVAELKVYTVNQPNENKTVLVRIGLSSVPWETLATHKPEDDEETYTLDDGAAAFGQAYEKDGKTFLPFVHNLQKKSMEQAFQVVAITNSGGEFTGGGTGSGGNVLHSSTCNFTLPLKEIREFQFQTRPYQWATFKNVSLKPKFKTDVQIEVEKPTVRFPQPVESELTKQPYKQTVKEITVSAIEKISFEGNDIIQVKANPKAGFNFPFYLFVPKSIDKDQKAYFLVEANNTGKTSDELEIHQEKAFRLVSKNYPNRIARSLGSPLLVPVFPRPGTNWQAYTHALDRDSLEIKEGKLKRIDLQLTAMIKYAQELLRMNGFKIHDKVFMHGFSASAKFCNRYSFLHPEMVKAVASGGVNGLPTLPISKWNDYELPFPIGISGIERFTDKPFDEKAFRKVAHYIYMGVFDRNDTLPSRDAWSEEEADIIKNALAEKMMPDRWELSQKIYKDQNINAQCVTYNGVSHSIKDEMLDDVIRFFKANSGNKYVAIEPHQYPFVEYKQIKHAHINGLYWPDDERLPEWINKNSKRWSFLIGIEEWIQGQDHRQLVEFCKNAGFNFVLKAEGQKDIFIRERSYPGSTSQGSGEFQAFCAKLNDSQFDQMVPGVPYKLEPLNKSDEYFWTVNDGVTLTKAADDALTYSIEFEITNQQFLRGDSIQITEILGSTYKIETGQTYTIKGKYKLSSHDRAMLNIYATDGQTHSNQGPLVDKGTGDFTRTLTYLEDGWLHLSFYPAEGGSSFGSLYFAQKGSSQKPLKISEVKSAIGTLSNDMRQFELTSKEAIRNKLKILQEQQQRVEGDLADVEKALDNVRVNSGITDLEEHSYPHPITARLTRLQEEKDNCMLEISQLEEKMKNLQRRHVANPDNKQEYEKLEKAQDDMNALQRKFEQLSQMVREANAQKNEFDHARSVYQRRMNIRDDRRERLNVIKSQIEKLKIMYEEADSPTFKKDKDAAKMLTIEVSEDGEERPKNVLLKIPLAVLDIRNTQIPEKAKQQMDKHGITLEKIVKMFENDVKPMTLLEVKEENSHVLILLE